VPGWQAPAASQVSLPLQAFESAHDVPAATGVCVMPATGSQASAVHGLPSSSAGGVPATQAPEPLQVSAPLQAFVSAHDVPEGAGTCVIPAMASHASTVHGFPSSRLGGVPGWQAPAASQVSLPLHAFESAQEVPAATGVCVTPPFASQASAVHGLPSSTGTPVPPPQAPEVQTSPLVHALPSSQALPLGFDGFEQAPVTGLHVPAR